MADATIDPGRGIALPRNGAGEVILAQADFYADGKIAAWQCTDCREEYPVLYRLLRHLARSGDPRVVIDLENGEITRLENGRG